MRLYFRISEENALRDLLHNELVLAVGLPLAGGTLTVWVYGLEVLSILLLFHLERSPWYQS